ncbi:MAG: MurR/RpiR family transcriptional regulator [Pseudomonadota bacterium]
MKERLSQPFLTRVTEALSELHPSERKLADLVLDFPGDMAGYTATELAELAEVSNATVTRFIRRIGYASFDEARRAVRDEQRNGSALLRLASGKAPADGVVDAHRNQSFQNLERTYELIDEGVVDSLCSAMIDAPKIWVVGFRAGQSHAQYLGWQVSQVLSSVSLLPRAGETLAESVSSVSKNDIVILVALRRNVKLAVPVAQSVKGNGARLAVIEDRPLAGMPEATWRFSCVTSTNGPLMNHVATIALCNLIASRTIELSGADGRRRMAAIEKSHRHLDEM